MPELPEVEHARRVIERVAVGHRVIGVTCADDPIVFADGRRAVERALADRCLRAAHRHGKWLWIELDRGPHVLLHLGMTGSVRTPGDAPLRLQASAKELDRAWPPRFAKLTLELDGDRRLAFTNARRLGRVLVRADPRAEPPLAGLGFDPLLELPPLARFRALLGRRRGLLKGLLLDQTFAAGVGNWMADEILYQAEIDPRRAVGSLREDEVRRLHSTLRDVVRVAVDADAVSDRYPAGWLFHRRWEEGTRTADGEPIVRETISGRTTAWVPARQR